jgi:multiple sugar transport system ATP-binding protein
VARVAFENVSKHFDDTIAVDELDLEIDDGEFMVFLGPSGCGKTTALRMIAGLEEVTAGRIHIGDRIVNRVEPAKRDVAMVFQSYALYPHMTVERNIESPLRIRRYHVDGPGRPPRKLTRTEREERVTEAAQILGLTPFLGRKPAALSGGQRQRVALARAWVGRPQAFLLDEPLSNLDAKLRAATRTELVELHRRVETTVVYVTHDQVEAISMASRVAILSQGRLQQVGTPQEVYEAPANLFVAHFIGTPPMNTLPGVVTTHGRAPTVDVAGSRFPLPAQRSTRLEEGQPVVVGVRPEHLRLSPGGEIIQKVRNVEWLGHECLISGQVGGNDVVVRQAGMAPHDANSEIRFTADPANVHLFDPGSTDRLT